MKDFIEARILGAVRVLLAEKANSILGEMEFAVPFIEIGGSAPGCVAPVISLATCERSEKERIVLLDAYAAQLTFAFADTPESELYCYAFAAAVDTALRGDVTLGGVAERAVLTGKRYAPPKTPHCGEGWAVTLILRITVTMNREQ